MMTRKSVGWILGALVAFAPLVCANEGEAAWAQAQRMGAPVSIERMRSMAAGIPDVSAREVAAGVEKAATGPGCFNATVSDQSARQLLNELSYLSSPYDRNMRVEQCFGGAIDQLQWSQVKILLDGLSPTYYSSYSGSQQAVHGRMLEAYMRSRMRALGPAAAVAMARVHISPYTANELLKEYYVAGRKSLSWNDVRTLLEGLVSTYSSNYEGSKDKVNDFLVADFVNLRTGQLDLDAVIGAAGFHSSPYSANSLLEAWFNSRKGELTWPQVQRLVRDGLRDTYQTTVAGSRASTTDRIIKVWTASR